MSSKNKWLIPLGTSFLFITIGLIYFKNLSTTLFFNSYFQKTDPLSKSNNFKEFEKARQNARELLMKSPPLSVPTPESLMTTIETFNKSLEYLKEEEMAQFKADTIEALQKNHIRLDQAFDFYRGLAEPLNSERKKQASK